MTTKHTCGGPVFGRRTAGCPRCEELPAGATPATIATATTEPATTVPMPPAAGCLPPDVAAALTAAVAAAETAGQAARAALLAAAGTDPAPDLDTDALPWPGNADAGDVRTAAAALLARIVSGPRGYDAWTHTARLAEWITEAATMAAGGQGAGARTPHVATGSPVPPMNQQDDLTQAEIGRRMADAAHTEKQGRYREATHLYDQLGKDIQARHGRFDTRALDAFEGMARTIREDAEDKGAR